MKKINNLLECMFTSQLRFGQHLCFSLDWNFRTHRPIHVELSALYKVLHSLTHDYTVMCL